MPAKVSIIIPCYNHGQYVPEAVASCLAQTYPEIEIIIVNDGSTDEATNSLLKAYSAPRTRVLTTENQGLAMARNTGIAAASGSYILPLDADDKIAPTYVEKAVALLEANPALGIVYCEAAFFGAESGKWELFDYEFPAILSGNRIFCSALYRKCDWEKVGGYKKEMKYGWEDWEFWLSLIETGCKVYRIPETLFFYRKHPVSMLSQLNEDEERQDYLWNQLFRFHAGLYKRYRRRLASEARRRYYRIDPPFIYKERTETHLVIHLGSRQWRIPRKKC